MTKFDLILGDKLSFDSILKLMENVSTMLYTPYLLNSSGRREECSYLGVF